MPLLQRNNNPTKPNNILRLASNLLALLGALDALYLWIYKISSNDKMCLGNGGCASVNYSSFSEVYGIPVAFLGLVTYLVILVILLLEPSWKIAQQYGTYIVFGISLVGVLFSAYLTYIEYFVIYAVCPFCFASAIIMTLLFFLSIARLGKTLN